MWVLLVACVCTLVTVEAQDAVPECPAPDGFFADAEQCDRYYECVDNVLTEKMCADGLAFVDLNPRIEKCDYISSVDCTGRPKLQPAQPTDTCPRQNGYFKHPVETVCNKFYFCNAGTGNLVTCPEGLVYGLESHNCVWPDVAAREGCTSDVIAEFDCPKVTDDIAVSHPRYPDPTDCQYFYVCISGINPRRNGCAFGQVFNSKLAACDAPQEVPECADYYTAYFEDYFNTLTSTDGRVSVDILAAALASGYDVPSLQERFHVDPKQLQTQPRPSRARGVTEAPAVVTPAAGTVRKAGKLPARRQEEQLVPEDAGAPPTTAAPRSTTPKRRFRPQPATTTTTPPPPPPPPQGGPEDYTDYTEYTDGAVYDYGAEVPLPPPTTTTPEPVQQPASIKRRIPLRRPRPSN